MAVRARKSAGKAKKVQERAPAVQGWSTTNAEEIERRRWRGLTDIAAVENLEPAYPYFGTYRVRSTIGGTYNVETRSLTAAENSCGCPDWRVNGLGTCKHIEGVLELLRRRGKRAFVAAAEAGSPRAAVTVFNLVCEDSIEHRIEHVLSLKQGLANGVLDGRGDIAALKMPSGRAAMVERLAALMRHAEPAPPVLEPSQRFAADIVERLDEAVLLIERHRRDGSGDTMVVVMEGTPADLDEERRRQAQAMEQAGIAAVEIIDRATWETIRRLAGAGVICLPEAGEELHRSAALDKAPQPEDQAARIRNRKAALDWLTQADRKLRMATLLADGGFAVEALPALGDAASLAMRGLAIIVDPGLEPAAAEIIPDAELAKWDGVRAHLPPGSIAHFAPIGDGTVDIQASRAAAQGLLAAARAAAEQPW